MHLVTYVTRRLIFLDRSWQICDCRATTSHDLVHLAVAFCLKVLKAMSMSRQLKKVSTTIIVCMRLAICYFFATTHQTFLCIPRQVRRTLAGVQMVEQHRVEL